MARYRALFRKSVEKDFSSIPKRDVKKNLNRIKTLEENPRPPGSEKLTGQERYRLRHGRYRIVYSIQDDEFTIWVVKIGHRKVIYR
ncbi:MAG: type II toxin-antitoxin system RelE/ParE family toxin [Deltaproteobacteria bacterium]|nr:type II toxin-antitoxin system RelE/ParE family toxin [Deltaproteobacteria bacterium]MBW1959371.1 type II toxin-antitoxin system RelE/ParE family toxin [Deltaproteobacteria bacterium]